MKIAHSSIMRLNWCGQDIKQDTAFGYVNWAGLVHYATRQRAQRDGVMQIPCKLSSDYNKGGRNLVRRIEFQDGITWIARIQLPKHTEETLERLSTEVHTMAVVRQRSSLPVPEVYAYENNTNNEVGVPFILMEFIPGNTIMDSFGGYEQHQGQIPIEHQAKLRNAIADIQVRF
jgi:aminoglycoside phosphotransferase (APT) family kinase protein